MAHHLAVGGEILDMALARAKNFARFVMCGAISQYNAATVEGPKVGLGSVLLQYAWLRTNPQTRTLSM